MLPSRKQEIRQSRHQPSASFDNSGSSTNHSKHNPQFEFRQIKRQQQQHTQGFNSFVSSGTGVRKHRKHRSQPSNFMDNDILLLNAARAIIMQNASERNASAYPTGNRDRGRFDENARYRSIIQSTKNDNSLNDTTNNNMTNQQAQPHFEVARPRTQSSCNFNYMPLTPGSTYNGFLSQQSNANAAQQYTQQSLIHQMLTTPTSKRSRPDVKVVTPIRPAGQLKSTNTDVQINTNSRRRHSLDTSPYRQQDEFFMSMQTGLPSPPNTAPLMSVSQFDMAPMPHPEYASIAALAMGASEFADDTYYSPSSSSDGSSEDQGSPEMEDMNEFVQQGPLFDISTSCPELSSESGFGLGAFPDLGQTSSSVSRLVPNALYVKEEPMSSGLVNESGISHDEIVAFISGPEASDGKWVCLYPECNKRFGRKENIKSHVQTHLGDRQFQCNVCKKCFVRQHDLKRHSKIHTGVKPYPCKCGNSFARHDALTRHRQRGMCIGAFEGIVKKIVKRGRPKKIRNPESSDADNNSSNGKSRQGSSSMEGSNSSRSGSHESSSPPAFDENDLFSDLPTSPSPQKSSQGQNSRKRQRSLNSDDEFDRADTKRQQLEPTLENPYSPAGSLDFSTPPPSSPPFDDVTTPGNNHYAFAESEFTGSFGDAELSFTPIGSPEYDVLHRRLASAYNTPEWSGPTIASEQEVDLRDILGLDDLGESTSKADMTFEDDWGKNNLMGANMSMDMGLLEDGFDFIKSELLNNDALDMWAGSSP